MTTVQTLKSRFQQSFPLLLFAVFLGGAMRGYSAPYIKLYLIEQGFSGALMGTILSVAALVELLFIPALSRFADHKQRHRLMWRGMMLVYMTACAAIIFFPHLAILGIGLLATEVSKRTTLVYSMQLSFTKIQQTGRDLHGRVRSASAGGFMLANATAGTIFHLGRYFSLFIAAIIAGLLSIWASKSMPATTFDRNAKPVEPTTQEAPPKEAPAKRNPALYIILFTQFLAAVGLRNGLLFWLIHFQANLGIDTAQIALLVTISSLLEIPWMMYMDRLLSRYFAIHLYIIGLLGMAIFWVTVGIIPSFIWALAILLLRAPAFSLTNVTTLYLINKISAPKNVATNMTLSQITIPSVAGLVSSAPMGYAYDALPPQVFFGLCAVMLVIGAVTILTYQLISGNRQLENGEVS
ncbi:MAG: MFS transporter [Chloroflexi bacterium]|nr:MAG: MFS transporter [Chloroflexota bacterium]